MTDTTTAEDGNPGMKLEPNIRHDILMEAEKLVNGDRNVDYGDPLSDFRRTAAYWSEHINAVTERQGIEGPKVQLAPEDVAIMMALLKISRLGWSPEKRDNWVDLAGYAACGAHCADEACGGLK